MVQTLRRQLLTIVLVTAAATGCATTGDVEALETRVSELEQQRERLNLSMEEDVKRLEKLEEIASSYEGVEKVYAIQAGREIRIMVTPDKISDREMAELSEKTARRIENELQYPGQIKVVVIRETRAVDFAR